MNKVSIILVNYNGYNDTVECLESLNHINYIDYEIIIVDNGSTDDYEKLKALSHYKNVIILNAGENIGFSGGNNLGIQYAMEHNADYILLLNNDTLVEPNFLNYMVASSDNGNYVITSKILYAKERDKIWYAGGNFNRKTSRTSAYGINEIDSEKYSKEQEVNFASGCCILVPATILNNVGLMSEEYFLYCEDTDYCLRILNAGFKIIYEPKAQIYHKVNASTIKIAGIQAYYLVRNKLYIIKQFIEEKYKLLAYTYVYAETIKRVLTGEYDLNNVRTAIKDFKQGIKGKKR